MLLTAVFLAVGLGASLLATPVLQSVLINLPATDPVTFAGVSALLIATALVACYVPARRESIRLPPFAPSGSLVTSDRALRAPSPPTPDPLRVVRNMPTDSGQAACRGLGKPSYAAL
ncbi:MAG: hypothetical protein GEU99_23890 [Luteitalea sp.]|nr:hypothetical protein [Luteitalea sp.]